MTGWKVLLKVLLKSSDKNICFFHKRLYKIINKYLKYNFNAIFFVLFWFFKYIRDFTLIHEFNCNYWKVLTVLLIYKSI